MAYYYVKNGGTAIGDAGRYASQQSGSFAAIGASGYYNDIQDCIDNSTTTPASNDFINVSDIHFFSNAAITYTGSTTQIPYLIVCVDDSNIDAGRTSGNRAIENSPSSDITTTNGGLFSGLELQVGDDMVAGIGSSVFYDCKLVSSGVDDKAVNVTNAQRSVLLIGCEVALDNAGSVVGIAGGSSLIMQGGSVTSLVGANGMINGGFNNGGGALYVSEVDLSGITGVILNNLGQNSGTDTIDIKFDLCKIAVGVAYANEDFKFQSQRALFTRCSNSSASAEYQYFLRAYGGDVEDDSAIFRNEDEAFTESNQKISYKITTNAIVSVGSPLWLDFPVLRYSELSAGATDTLRFYLTSNTALTNKDIYIEISYPDGTNKQTPNFLSSAPLTVGGTLDLMAAGTTLTTDSTSTWTGGLTNKYQIDLNTSVDVGADCLPIVKVYITKPSITIQIASEFGLS